MSALEFMHFIHWYRGALRAFADAVTFGLDKGKRARTMRLNHLHLMVSDAEGAARFLETYFGMSRYPGGREKFLVMGDGGGMTLALMQGRDCAYPKNFHIGFDQPSEAEVNRIWERMKADGHAPSTPTRAHAWSFYVMARAASWSRFSRLRAEDRCKRDR